MLPDRLHHHFDHHLAMDIESEYGGAPPARLFMERPFDRAEAFFQALLPTGLFGAHHRITAQRWLFRGQGDATWTLVPKAFRENALAVNTFANVEVPFTTARKHAELEHDGILRFAVDADRAGFLLPGDAPTLRDPRGQPAYIIDLKCFPPRDYLALAALAQHYGIRHGSSTGPGNRWSRPTSRPRIAPCIQVTAEHTLPCGRCRPTSSAPSGLCAIPHSIS